MIHIFGDSHAHYNFKNLTHKHINHFRNSITLHRVGRDGKKFINFDSLNLKKGYIILYQFGEVDCRCQIHKQLIEKKDL